MKNIDKMDYDSVYQVFDTLHFVFGAGDGEEIDDRCQALWVLFLSSVGWSSDEFWEEFNQRQDDDDVCPDCGGVISFEPTIDKKNQN
jgi:hypothetical protein